MLLNTRTVMDEMLGEVFDFYGANVGERTFRLKTTDGTTDRLFRIVGDKRAVTAIEELPAGAPIPRGCRRDTPLGTVMVYDYDKQDNLHNALSEGTPFSAAVFNKGYQLIGLENGHPWLRFGHHNYRSVKGQRVAFIYSVVEDDEENEDEE